MPMIDDKDIDKLESTLKPLQNKEENNKSIDSEGVLNVIVAKNDIENRAIT